MMKRRATTATADAILSATVLVALIAAPLARADDSFSDPSVVSTTAGKVKGEVGDGVYAFKGIPYAADTSRANRWAAPKDPEPWSDVRDATTFMDICPQATTALAPYAGPVMFGEALSKITGDSMFTPSADTPMSEDCLGLNVYVPTETLDQAWVGDVEKLPVMVWIHGGSLDSGAGSLYPGDVLVNAGDVIVVTINYRLGFLGYIAHPELNGTNFGLLDQVKALEWVKDNIANFSGDPSKVTIFGESAGGTSVMALMASPLSEGLFQRAISQSASVMESPNVTASEGGKLGVAVGEQLGLPAGDGQLEEMRAVSFEKLVEADANMSTPEYNSQPINLYVDDTSLPSCIFCALQEGSIHQADLMIGTNNNETSIFNMIPKVIDPLAPLQPNSTSAYEQDMDKIFGEEEKEVLSLFPGSPDSDTFATYNLVDTAGIFGAPAFFAANTSNGLGNPTFFYNFRGTANMPLLDPLGGFHALDLAYIWVGDTDLGKAMQKFWTTFAKTGNPDAEWKAYENASPSWQVLSEDKVGMEPVPEDMQGLYAIINGIYPNWQAAQQGGYDYFTNPTNTTDA